MIYNLWGLKYKLIIILVHSLLHRLLYEHKLGTLESIGVSVCCDQIPPSLIMLTTD